ncbi:MAG TPA: Fic family protein [Planctomycetota bacterium]|nr:Fic family protein [Planctomycetota bacterium]
MKRKTGTYERIIVGDEEVAAFLPAPLPPRHPALDLSGALEDRLIAAEQALRRLELAGAMVPSIDWFLYAFVRKEAVITSQIEGTQSTLLDLLRFESEEGAEAGADLEEVCNYLRALDWARSRISDRKGLPLSVRLLNETHARLMQGVRGADKHPGEVRRSQSWIGGSRPGNAVFVPPPPHALPDLLAGFEKAMHAKQGHPALIRAGLLHVQFESIHPYLDGNGRIGRLLITLLLEHWKLLSQPLLYLSLFFKRHQAEYYRRLGAVRTEGDWEGWLDFFLDGVATIADEAVTDSRELSALVIRDRGRVISAAAASVQTIRLFESLPRHPLVSVGSAMRLLQTTKPTAGRAIDALVEAGVLVETTGRQRGRWFAYQKYLERLRAGTDLDPMPSARRRPRGR